MADSDTHHAGSLIWIDLEMTGLDTSSDNIIEIATIVTDSQLNEIAEGPVLAIRQSQGTMSAMDEWNTRQHGESGLTQRVLESDIGTAQAEQATIEFLAKEFTENGKKLDVNSILAAGAYRFYPFDFDNVGETFYTLTDDTLELNYVLNEDAPSYYSGGSYTFRR